MDWKNVRRMEEAEIPSNSELVSIWIPREKPIGATGIVTKKFAIEGTGLEGISTFWVIPPKVNYVLDSGRSEQNGLDASTPSQ
ncbi:MAG: hypothetical protein HZA95_00250 [Candidatus Vogelbacteria bacterium]|nr:hypothetical protein [Candidatus Vogelbacteria bacterium]